MRMSTPFTSTPKHGRFSRIVVSCAALVLALGLAFTGCGDDSTSPEGGVPVTDMSGIWGLEFEVVAKAVCDREIGDMLNQDVPIVQSGKSATMIIDGAIPVPLTINGSAASGSWEGDFGIEVALSLEDGNLTGTLTMTQTDCTEVYSLSGARSNDLPSSDFKGYWDYDLEVAQSDCEDEPVGSMDSGCISVGVNGNSVSIDTGNEVILGVGDGDTAYFYAITEEEVLRIQLTVAADDVSGTVSSYDQMNRCSVTSTIAATRRETPCPPVQEGADFSGFWNVDGEFVSNGCGFELSPDCLEFAQDGNEVSILGESLTGTVEGNTATLTQSIQFGTSIISSEVILVLSTDGNSFSGTNSISVVDEQNPQNNCTSLANMSGLRTSSCLPVGPEGSVMGILPRR